MKCIIAGGRNITNYYEVVKAIVDSGWKDDITEVVCGMAKGADLLGKEWADTFGVPVKPFPVTDEDYRIFGRYQAPKVRNGRMANYADALILIWDGKSGGSADMLSKAKERGLRYFVHKVTP